MIRLSLLLLLISTTVPGGEKKIVAATTFLAENRAFTGKVIPPPNYKELHQKISANQDPQSKFGYIVFSLARNRKKLLSEEQGNQLNALIKTRQDATVNWHDVRNIVRVHAVFALWKYVAATDPAEADEHKAAWEGWTDLRVAYMFEEFVDKERFQRVAWNILTDQQKGKLLSGEWEEFLKKSTGHGRLYSAPRQVIRELGRPHRREVFDEAAKKWEIRWDAMWADYLAASVFQQKREIAMDLADESFAVAAWDEYAREFRKFVTMERDAIRELVQVGYDFETKGVELEKKIVATEEKFRSGMIGKYRKNAPEFLGLLGYESQVE